MKACLILLLAVFFASCLGNTKTAMSQEREIDHQIRIPEFQSIIYSSGVIGSILLYDYQKDTYYSNDFERANEGKLPASTFKIAHSIIGLETGVIKNDSVIFKWDGTPKGNKN